jgi:WD40 repeat protein
MAAPGSFYKAGGTLEVDVPSYVVRKKADDALGQHIRQCDFCYVLTARQMGKSSLSVRTAQRLQESAAPEERWNVAVVDLSLVGSRSVQVTADAWYLGIVKVLAHEFDLPGDVEGWWAARAAASPVLRLHEFLRDVVLKNTTGPVVVFVDEIDSTLSLDFTDDFFAMIRACYNARATDPDFRRLVFVLLGVARPADLIKDVHRTPFNIGTRIELTDFTSEEAQPLAAGLGDDPGIRDAALQRVLYWTDGHPYLTQKVCQTAAGRGQDKGSPVTPELVDGVVESLFAPGSDRTDDNLKWVRDQVIKQGPLTRQILTLYRRVLNGKKVLDDPVSRAASELKLSGLVKVQSDGTYKVRNKVYERVFDLAWVKKERPPSDVLPLVVGVAATLLVLVVPAVPLWYEFVYPRQFIYTLEQASPLDPKLASEAHESLRRVWFRAGQADRLWCEYNLKRAGATIPNDRSGQEASAFRMAGEAYQAGVAIPGCQDRAERQYAEFFKDRARRAAYQERRDWAILWWLKALSVRSSDGTACRAAVELTGGSYERLIRTVRLPPVWEDVVWHPDGCLSADGRMYVGLSSVTAGVLWSVQDDRTLRIFPSGFSELSSLLREASIGLAVSRDGHRLAVRSSDALWVLRTELPIYGGTPLLIPGPSSHPKAFPDVSSRVGTVALSDDGRWVATAGDDGIVWSWDMDQLSDPPRPYLDGEAQSLVRALVFSPDGRRLAAAGDDQVVRVWDVRRPTEKFLKLRLDRTAGGRDGRILALAFSPDGHHLAAGGDDQVARVWELEKPDGSPLALLGDVGPIRLLRFAPDGRSLAGAGPTAVRVWDATNPAGATLRLEGDGATIAGLAFPDVDRLVTGDTRGAVRDWNLTRFVGGPVEAPTAGPCPKLGDWEERLGLTIDARGAIVHRPSSGTVERAPEGQRQGQAVPAQPHAGSQ